MKDGHVSLRPDKHYYSVPYRFIGQKVNPVFSSSSVEVYFRYERIALHSRNYTPYKYSTHREHLASSHQFIRDWSPELFIQRAVAIHQDVALYVSKVIDYKQHPEQAYKSCSCY
jgi:hypothetical protein